MSTLAVQHRNHSVPDGCLDDLITAIRDDLAPQMDLRLRTHLAGRDREWLIDQLVALTLGRDSERPVDSTDGPPHGLHVVRPIQLDEYRLDSFVDRYRGFDRGRLVADGYLTQCGAESRRPGDRLRTSLASRRTPPQPCQGRPVRTALRRRGVGDPLDRSHRELLTFTLPRTKTWALRFLRASTEYSAVGTWRDPHGSAHDNRADNVVFEIEYGEVDTEYVGDGIVRCMSLINHLEVNEQLLYARMIDVEQSTLCG